MTEQSPPPPSPRFRWEWAVLAGLALALVALWLWVGAGGGGRVLIAWLIFAALGGCGVWMERRSKALRLYGHLLIAGGIAGYFGSICAGYAQEPPGVFHAWWLAWPLLAIGAAALVVCSGVVLSPWLGLAGFGLALLGVTLQPFTCFSLAANVLLLAVALHFFRRYRWTAAAWLALVGFHLAFLLRWPFDDGRIETDRFLDLTEYWATLAFFALAWLVFLRFTILSRAGVFTSLAGSVRESCAPVIPSSRESLPRKIHGLTPEPRRLFFATLNNVLFYLLGVLILPPRYPDWYWKFTAAAGFLFLGAWAFTDRYAPLRRAFAIHGVLLVALGTASAVIGPQPAAMLAVASAFFVLAVEQRGQWLLRYCAGLSALLAVAFAVEPIFGSDALQEAAISTFGAFALDWGPFFGRYDPSLWLGVFTGAPLVFASIWISRHPGLWRRWAVLLFGTLGLGTWLLTTLAQTPAQHHPPILAIEAVLVTASILLLAIPEFPILATSVLLLAQFLWFQHVGDFNARPWWNPLVVFACTLGLSWWWQTRGRVLVSAPTLRLGQGIAAAAAIAILLLSLETVFGRSATALIVLSLAAIGMLAYGSFLGDWLLFGFTQLIVATAIGEFIGQLSHAPLPVWFAPLFPIGALLVVAVMIRSPFATNVWETPARWVALLYRALAAAMLVVWVLHYFSAANRFLILALIAAALLLLHLTRRPHGPLLASVICAAGALLAFWLNWSGVNGFRLRDLLAFLLLLGFGQILRRMKLLPDEVQSIGILLGLASVTQWVENWSGFHHPQLPVSVAWAAVAAAIVCVGWWLRERLYRLAGWALLLAALVRVLWFDLIESNLPAGSDPAFRLGLLAVGLAALIAALGYARRPTAAGK